MFGGLVVAKGAPEVILHDVPGTLVELTIAAQIDALVRLEKRFTQVEAVGSKIKVFVPDVTSQAAGAQIQELLTGIKIEQIQLEEPGLEDAFIALLHRHHLAGKEEDSPAEKVWRDSDPPQGDGIAIVARELICDFDHFRAVDRVSFEVRQGEIFGLLAANGAGKTTVIKMLTGIRPPTGGAGTVAGADMRRASQSVKERIGYVSQAFSLYQDMTVQENLRLFARIYGVPGRQISERIDRVVQLAGLGPVCTQLAGKLPMGIRQRLALACALVHGPLVLFLDEPTSGVDPIGRRRFWKILVHLARVELVAILLTTHYMSEAEHCDHLALMHAGKVIADDTPAALKTALGQEAGQVLDLAAEPVLSALEALEQAGISILNILILWLMVIWLFGAPFKGDPLFFFLASTIYVTCTTGIGLLVSLLVRTQVAAMMMTVVVTVVPSVLYSGLLVPIASMDPAGQFEAHLFPAMYYTDIILGSFLKGVGMEQLWGKVLALLIYAIVLWTASFLMFHKRPKS